MFISNKDKNNIKADGGGDPTKMTRMTLIALFGRETLAGSAITAIGTKAGTLGMRKNVRNVIRGMCSLHPQPSLLTLPYLL